MQEQHRVSVRAPHGVGKSALSAMLVLWFALTHDGEDWKVPTLASAWRQLEEFLWPEIHKWARYLKWSEIGRKPFKEDAEMLTLSLRLRTGSAFALASDKPELVEGAHARHILYLFDESKSIIDGTWDSVEGAMAAGNCVLADTWVVPPSEAVASRRWYKGPVLHLTTAAGYRLAVTPDHPILTPTGWQCAGALRQFDDIVGCRDVQTLMAAVEPDADHVPARIEDVFDSAHVRPGVLAQLLKVPDAEDLNRRVAETQIDVVGADCPLWAGRQPPCLQRLKQLDLVDRVKPGVRLLADRHRVQVLRRERVAQVAHPATAGPPQGPVGVGRHLDGHGLAQLADRHALFDQHAPHRVARDVVFVRHVAQAQQPLDIVGHERPLIVRLPLDHRLVAADLDAAFDQGAVDGAGRDVEFVAQLYHRFPGLIFTDHITDIVAGDFVGHVYNLQTATHWFTANANSLPGSLLVHNCKWISVSTPGVPAGRFYEIQARKPGYEDWKVRPVKLHEAIDAGRINADWAERRRIQWGESSVEYQNRVLGEFASSASDAIVPFHWIEAAQERWHELEEAGAFGDVDCIGVDVGRSSDSSVFALRSGNAIIELQRHGNPSSTIIASKIIALMRRYSRANAVIDVIGVGAGVYDQVFDAFPQRTFPFNASEATDFTDHSQQWRFINTRAAAWWNVREHLDPALGHLIALPEDDFLPTDLASPTYTTVGHGRYKVESKDDVRKRLGRSTDHADAVIAAFWDQQYGGMGYA